MIIRSITLLPIERDMNNVANGRIEMSIPKSGASDTKFCSKLTYYSDIKTNIKAAAVNEVVSNYELNDASSLRLSLRKLHLTVNTISAENVAFDGIKEFKDWPHVNMTFPTSFTDAEIDIYGDNGEYILPNVKTVKQLVDDNVIFMSTTSSVVAEGNPLPHHLTPTAYNAGVPESLDYANTIGSNKFYYWLIDDGGTDSAGEDSAEAIHDENSGSKDAYELIRDTGNLVAWGWLAENPDNPPRPEQCWVAMYALMKCEGYNDTHVAVPISVKPWIRGVNSSTLQYVGFNIPVKRGLRIKIVTGFNVNGSNSGFLQGNTLTFKDKWVPNAFYGYVIK